jgi:hypothetical protein
MRGICWKKQRCCEPERAPFVRESNPLVRISEIDGCGCFAGTGKTATEEDRGPRAGATRNWKIITKFVYCGHSIRSLSKARLLLKEGRIVGCELVTLIRPAYLHRGEFG